MKIILKPNNIPILLLFLFGTAAQAGPAANIKQLHFLTGNWIGKFGPADIEENWLAPEGGSIVAMVRVRPDDSATSFYEIVMIEESGDTLVLNVNQFGPGFTSRREAPQHMELEEITSNSVKFKATANDGFASIAYTRRDEQNFQIQIVRGDGSLIDIPMKARSLWK